MDRKKFYRYLSLNVWGGLPSYIQRKISAVYTTLYNTRFSRHIIAPYSRIQYQDPSYLNRFKPANGTEVYLSFQDFFIRKFNEMPEIKADYTWPCEGLLCEYDMVDKLQEVTVKKQRRNLRSIFGQEGSKIPDNYFFANIFLHNSDYHRIHAPVNGVISRIEHIPGDLVLLRPWIYGEDPSHPALRNERYNLDITDSEGKIWYLSIVGGPAVGTIALDQNTYLNASVETGDEIATFLLGSTCCIATPIPASKQVGEKVSIGDPL